MLDKPLGRQLMLVAYLVVFALFFLVVAKGVGQYWDWAFPFFSDQISTVFSNRSLSWTPLNEGSPLGYASDYFWRFFVSLFGFLAPELLRYLLLVIIFAAGAYGVYLLAEPRTNRFIAFLLGLIAMINPAIFYKFTAGHFNYLLAYTLFIYLLYFLFCKFRKDLRSAVVVGLLLAFMGAQIQFFLFGFLFLALFFIFYRKRFFSVKYAAVILLLPMLINLVWLSNFFTGGADVAETGANAAKEKFTRSSSSDYLSIFTFQFSKATLLSKFYVLYELLWHTALFLILLWFLVRKQHKQMIDVLLLSFLIILMFLGTGVYQSVNLGPLTAFYPMFREVGHFAPLIMLTALIMLCRLARNDVTRWALGIFLVGSIFIVTVKFQYFSQAINFPKVREQFEPFKKTADNDKGTYRILAYPFFGKYSFTAFQRDLESEFPLKNAGHDSFAAYSKQEFINNAVAPHEFKDSAQYKLLQTYDIDVLKPYNVKYIYNFSDVYESNYDRYVPAKTYDNDPSMIKNDKEFFNRLLAHNPGRLRQVGDNILEIVDYTPRVFATDTLFMLDSSEHAEQTHQFARRALRTDFNYTLTNDKFAASATKLQLPFQDVHETMLDKKQKTLSEELLLSPDGATSIYVNTTQKSIFYRHEGNRLIVYAKANGTLKIGGKVLYEPEDKEQELLKQTVQSGTTYYLHFKGKLIAVQPGGQGLVGVGAEKGSIELFTEKSANLVSNPSFEQGSWQPRVGDCNNYDGSANLAMKLDHGQKTEGRKSLQLEATRHNACVSTKIELQESEYYALSYDFQSPNAQIATFYLEYGDEEKSFDRSFQAVPDEKWHSATTLLQRPQGVSEGRLFVYALEGDKETTVINRYDNFRMVAMDKVRTIEIPEVSDPYNEVALQQDREQKLTYQSAEYTYNNLLQNPSFERGLWRNKVSDCHNYDGRPQIGMSLNKDQYSEGKHSLQLEATRHNACTMTTVNITGGATYLLSFDYQGEGKGGKYGYNVSFDDPSASDENERIDLPPNNSWRRQSVQIKAPKNATTMTLHLYAFESNRQATNVVRYDNLQVVEIPDFTDRYYVVTKPQSQSAKPKGVQFTKVDTTKRHIKVKGVSAPFYLGLSESYHPGWQVALRNGKTMGLKAWLPMVPADKVPSDMHFKMNDYLNGWRVDPATLCQKAEGCTKNADGTYDLDLIAEFTPQRWMNGFTMLSSLTILVAAGYLVVVQLKRKREQ